MKTKLTLNIDDKIVSRAKKASAKKKVSLSSIVEDYLEKYSSNALPKKSKNIRTFPFRTHQKIYKAVENRFLKIMIISKHGMNI